MNEKETESEGERWKVKLIVFVGGTCGSVHVQSFNDNLKELGVVESKRGAIRKGERNGGGFVVVGAV